jgi:RimJ/RimL family protein N-acetyltransferase
MVVMPEDPEVRGTVLAPPGYPADLERDVVSPTGERYHLRPIRPDDAERLVAFHVRLSTRSTYLRFFRVHPVLSDDEVERFTCVDYRDRLALVVLRDDVLVAVGRFDRTPDTSEAEVAFVVADAHQHHGLARLLLDELARAAWERGITVFVAETLAENRPMIEVFLASGFRVTTSREYDTVSLRFGIEPDEAYRAVLAKREAARRRAAASRDAEGNAGQC